MFLSFLNDAEKRAFVQLADHLVAADDVVLESERRAVAGLKSEAGVPGAPGENLLPVDELSRVFSSRRSKVIALLELLGLAYADADFEVNERSMIVVAAHAMEIDLDELREFEGWVKGHVRHVEKALAMMHE